MKSALEGWVKSADGNPNWDALLEGYGATADYPACSFWQELLDYYPDAKVLLSTRDPERWFNSVNETIFSPDFVKWTLQGPMKEFMAKTVYTDFLDHIHDKDYMINYYNKRIALVRSIVPEEKLLVYEVKQGWGPLCNFLKVEVPNTPFPRVNSQDETRALLESLMNTSSESLEETAEKERGRLFSS